MRLGVVRNLRGYNEKTQPVFDKALEVLKAQGAELVEIPDPQWEDLSQEQRIILQYDFKQDLNAYLAGTDPALVKPRNLTEMIAFNETDEHEKMHGNDVWTASRTRPPASIIPNTSRPSPTSGARPAKKGIDKLLKDNNVSALVNLTGGPAAKTSSPTASRPSGAGSTHEKGAVPASATPYAAIAEYPHLTVPMGLVDGLPVGLSFVGTAWDDGKLIAYGYAYEQGSHARVPPPPFQGRAC